MMDSNECCAGSHQGELRRGGFYSCVDGTRKTYLESGIKACSPGFARTLIRDSAAAGKRKGCRTVRHRALHGIEK
ncbi:hypothetical protein [Paraburkholderia fynbosensis]|uniref:hypothetical protein n=1 Tax=Paraburkholderia fynbosensis TaxID=1200993 RepID=UPI001581D8F7|nr:hypothetical protein [Paraburkholderia fynbosensis]